MRYAIETVTEPLYEPVSRAEAKRWLRIDDDDTTNDLVVDMLPAFIIPAWEVSWPTIRLVPNALQILFTAGYAPGSVSPSDEASNQEVMPAKLRLWMESKIGTHNEFREQIISGTIVEKIPPRLHRRAAR